MRDWLNSILGQDGGRIAQFVLALAAVLLLILLLAWVYRRLQPAQAINTPQGGKGRKRLGVLEASDVDARRRLVLVRRDEVEHLIMIGGPNDLLIESRILRQGAQGAAAAGRPNLQQMPRPATAPTGTSQPMSEAADAPVPSAGDRAPTAPPPASSLVPPSVQEPAARPVPAFRRPASETEATSQLTAPPPLPSTEARRPSLGDLLSAAAAAKATDAHDVPQPIPAAPPPRSQRAPLPPVADDDDDREVPTQIVTHRPAASNPTIFPAPAMPAAPTMRAPTLTPPSFSPPAPAVKEQDVATQIERALSDINTGSDLTPAPTEFVRAEVTRTETVHVEAVVPPPRRATLQPPTPQTISAPVPPRPSLSEPVLTPPSFQPTPVTQPAPVREEVPATPPRSEPPAPAPAPRPAAPSVSAAPRPEPAPAPVSAPVPAPAVAPTPPPAASVDPASAKPRSKDDDLEEEMAKLLSELGGPGAR